MANKTQDEPMTIEKVDETAAAYFEKQTAYKELGASIAETKDELKDAVDQLGTTGVNGSRYLETPKAKLEDRLVNRSVVEIDQEAAFDLLMKKSKADATILIDASEMVVTEKRLEDLVKSGRLRVEEVEKITKTVEKSHRAFYVTEKGK